MTPSSEELLEALRVSAKDASRYRAESEQLRYRAHEPIAIVGMAAATRAASPRPRICGGS